MSYARRSMSSGAGCVEPLPSYTVNSIAIVPQPVWLVRPLTTPAWVTNAAPYRDDPLADAEIPRAQRRSLLQLSWRTCRWPVGDPVKADFFFCGALPREGEAYCAAHCARAVRPEQRARSAPRGDRESGARQRRTMRALRDMDRPIAFGSEAAAEAQAEEGA